MTKIEELKAAFEAEPYGLSPADKDTMEPRLIRFYDAAHNLMPTLLEAIDLLETVGSARACQDHEFDVDAWFKQVRSLMFKLK